MSAPTELPSDELTRTLQGLQALMQKINLLLPPPPPVTDWSAYAFRWRKLDAGRLAGQTGYLQPVWRLHGPALLDLHAVDEQKQQITQNTRQFVAGRPANNVLLTGARGTGKSSLIKACLREFMTQGLRLIEVDRADLVDLPDIVELISQRSERFIIFCDDLSFEAGEPGYKALKVALDGSIAAPSENVLIYASSNRRHLLPEKFSDNETYRTTEDGDLHPGETVEEKIALSERFGLWLSFYPFSQQHYLEIVAHWMASMACTEAQIAAARDDALRWALQRGSRSGRVAQQFARDWVGRA